MKNDEAAPLNDTTASSNDKPKASNDAKPLVWMAKKVRITGHDLCYHDYSMKHDWEYAIKSLTVEGSNVATNGRNSVTLEAVLTGDAQLKADFVGGLDLATQDTRANLRLKGVNLHDFDALCRNYTGYPLDGGELMLDSHMDVVSGKMKGINRIEIDHPRVGKKERFSKAPYKNVPVRAGFQLLTSAQDMIILDVPVTGDAKSPKFKLGKVISRALLKVFFGPLMGVNDRDKSLSNDELEQMKELLGEEAADVTVTASDSVEFSEISE